LYDAYLFAQTNRLNKKNLLKAHCFVTKNILQESQQGRFRIGVMYVITDKGQIEYVAASPQLVESEMKNLLSDIETLLKADLIFEEVFFFASMLHLVFVKIHPFNDGNGRTARLFEKWFIAEKLGEKAWLLQSERHYYNNHQRYYNTIRKLGLEYEELKYAEAMPFLKMLPQSLNY
jgi:Fic family protein